tara:strand:- start:481 stop:1686 length:1206 start_codon:yes stop_codon:yes gene_type:complete
MSYNGSGTFQINTSGQPVVAGTVISSTAFNALTADLATGLSTAITKDGQTTATARIPFAQGITSTLVTDSSSVSTGSIITAGGVGIAKALFVGTTANIAGILSTTSPNITTSITTPSTSFDLINATATTLNLAGAATAVNVGAATGTMTVANTTLAAKAITASTTLSVTGVTTVQAGTAALPAITTTGDTNTGIFFPAADTIAFSEGGAEAMRIDSSGNLLVGTTTQATGALLTVNGSIKGTITSGTVVASTSGTSIDFTSIPSWVKRITVMFQNLSAAGVNSRLLIQLGDSGGIENTGYVSTGAYTTGGAGTSNSETTGYVLDNGGGQPSLFVTGTAVITLLDPSTNLWVATHVAEMTSSYVMIGGGRKTLSGTLDRVRITSVNGTNTFDSGSINIMYEG